MSGTLGRLGRLLVVVVLATVLAGLMTEFLPGDPVAVIAPFSNEAQRSAISKEYGFDKPFPVRYAKWAGDFLRGNMGYTYSGPTSKSPVSAKVRAALPVSLLLMLYAQVIALALAIPLAVWSAARAGSVGDRISSTASFAFASVPNFVLAFVLSFVFASKLRWFRPAGYTPPSENLGEHLRSMVLPSVALSLGLVSTYMRLLRADLIATLQQDFIVMAKSKGISPHRVLWRHALRPSSLTLVTSAGINVGALIGGALIIEYLFRIPGMGSEVQYAISARQYPALQSYVAVIVVFYVAVFVLIDVVYRLLDPRIRRG